MKIIGNQFLVVLCAVSIALAQNDDLREFFRNIEGFSDLTPCQQTCIAGTGSSSDTYQWLYSVVAVSGCSTQDCVCNNVQFIYDTLDECLQDTSGGGISCWTVVNYNADIEFFAEVCDFIPVLKAEITESIVYSTATRTSSTSRTTSSTSEDSTSSSSPIPTSTTSSTTTTSRQPSSTSTTSTRTTSQDPSPTSAGGALPTSEGTSEAGSTPVPTTSTGGVHLSVGAIAGIIIGAVLGTALAVLIVIIVKRRRLHKHQQEPTPQPPPSYEIPDWLEGSVVTKDTEAHPARRNWSDFGGSRRS